MAFDLEIVPRGARSSAIKAGEQLDGKNTCFRQSPASLYGKGPGLRLQEEYSPVMQPTVAGVAQRHKVFFGVVAGVAAEFLMMNFEVRHCAAVLTSPVVAPEHLLVKLFVRFTA
jgi:hypothetical protein